MDVQLLIFGILAAVGVLNVNARLRDPERRSDLEILSHRFFGNHKDKRYLENHGESGEESLNLGNYIGSRPPSCRNKCMGCIPCMPVEVTVPPGQATRRESTTESYKKPGTKSGRSDPPYYNMAWRCRCKGKYYNP